MKHLLTTSALALALGATAFANPAGAVDREPSYCGQSWLKVDTNNDGKVTQSEADAAFAKEFASIDASGDDIISRDEYRECRTSQVTSAAKRMREGGDQPLKDRQSAANAASEGKKSPIQAQTLQQVLRAADANDDGILTRREYAMAARKAYDEARRSSAQGSNAQGSNAQGSNVQGSNTQGSNVQGSGVDDAHRQAVTDPSMIAMRRFIVLVPQDGQGEQQANEQLRKMSRDEAAARSAMKFGALDRDGDGNLVESEWKTAAGDMMSGSMAEKHFKAIDEDDDGQVSREEYRNARNADMGEAEEAIQAWDEPQTLSEGQADQQAQQQGQQKADQQSGQQASGEQAGGQQQSQQQASGQKAGDRQEAAVPVYIFRFHTM